MRGGATLFSWRASREEEILATIKDSVARTKSRARCDYSADEVAQTIQVLTPMHRGLFGTINLNRELQALLNPSGVTLERGGATLRHGDKVMQLRNNYDKGVFNGDLGTHRRHRPRRRQREGRFSRQGGRVRVR